MRKAFLFSAILFLMLLVAGLVGCGSGRSFQATPAPMPSPTPTPTPAPESTTHLFAFLRNDGSTSGSGAQVSSQEMQSIRREAKSAHATARQTAITVEPRGINIYVWPFCNNGDGWWPCPERKITRSPGAYTSVHLSSNDKSIVFSALVNGYNQIFTSTVPADRQTMAEPIQLTTTAEHHWVPHISADGSKVAFTKFDASSNADVVCVINNTKGAVETCLDLSSTAPAVQGSNKWHASWSPDSTIFFEAWGDSLNSDEIFRVNADGSGLIRITNNAGTKNYDECPSIHSQSHRMVISTWNDNNQHYEIDEIDLDTKQRRVITDTNDDAWDPLFTYDTKVWVSQQEGDSSPQLYLDAFFDVVRLSSNQYSNYFESSSSW